MLHGGGPGFLGDSNYFKLVLPMILSEVLTAFSRACGLRLGAQNKELGNQLGSTLETWCFEPSS